VWNSPAFGNVSLSGDRLQWVALAADNADFWITVPPANSTNQLADLMHNYVDAVGHASRMPFDATGFIQVGGVQNKVERDEKVHNSTTALPHSPPTFLPQCKNRYRNQTQLLDVARGYVDRGLPISIIVVSATEASMPHQYLAVRRFFNTPTPPTSLIPEMRRLTTFTGSTKVCAETPLPYFVETGKEQIVSHFR
jgi:alpha-D-xyloside xylohydrolase